MDSRHKTHLLVYNIFTKNLIKIKLIFCFSKSSVKSILIQYLLVYNILIRWSVVKRCNKFKPKCELLIHNLTVKTYKFEMDEYKNKINNNLFKP